MQYSKDCGGTEVKPMYTLQGIDAHAANIRDNAWDINAGLRGILSHLRGEELSGCLSEVSPMPSGKLVEISLTQQGTRGAQDETFQLIAELKSLLNASA